jgi:hypothetical protein
MQTNEFVQKATRKKVTCNFGKVDLGHLRDLDVWRNLLVLIVLDGFIPGAIQTDVF